MQRSSGILMPMSSLPSNYGIGTMGKSAYKFIDFLSEAGQKYWQLLPLGPTSYGDSPYQSFSTFAGNPYFISLETLVEEGLLTTEECEAVNWGAFGSAWALVFFVEDSVAILVYAAAEDIDSDTFGGVGAFVLCVGDAVFVGIQGTARFAD